MSKKILVADDSVVIQKAIGITFAQEDFEVTFVGNGEEALQRAKEIIPDLILADTSMPKLSGFDLCKKLRMDNTFQITPIILLSNNKETFTPTQLDSFGANDFVQKPFESTVLLTKAKALLESTPMPKSNAVQRDILADSATVNEVPPAIGRSKSEPRSPAIDVAPTSADQHDYFGEKTSGEADLPLQVDSYSSLPTPGFVPNSNIGIDLLENDSDQEDEILPSHEPVIPEADFNTKVFQKPISPAENKLAENSNSSHTNNVPSLQLSEKQIEDIVSRVFQHVIERIAWEVVPDLAERIIKDEIEKLTQDQS